MAHKKIQGNLRDGMLGGQGVEPVIYKGGNVASNLVWLQVHGMWAEIMPTDPTYREYVDQEKFLVLALGWGEIPTPQFSTLDLSDQEKLIQAYCDHNEIPDEFAFGLHEVSLSFKQLEAINKESPTKPSLCLEAILNCKAPVVRFEFVRFAVEKRLNDHRAKGREEGAE